MSFNERNKFHQMLRKQLYLDAKRKGYAIQPWGHENLQKPISYQYNDETSWIIRATPDDIVMCKTSTVIEVKSKLKDFKNIAIELKPLEIYQMKPETIYIAAETKYRAGLKSVVVQNANDIKPRAIYIPDRKDNNGLKEKLIAKYPVATIKDGISVDGGSGTPYVLIFPDEWSTWQKWYKFRDYVILQKKEQKQTTIFEHVGD